MITVAKYNDVALTSITGLRVLKTDPYDTPQRKLSIFDLARTNRSRHNSAFYVKRQITVKVALTRDTRDQVEQSLDDLMAILQGLEQDLVLSQSGGVRRYSCSLADVKPVKAGGSFMELDLIFECADRFGYETNYTTVINLTAKTDASRADNFDFLGSAAWQVPVFSLKFTAVSGATDKAVTIGNNATGQAIVITRTWVANDTLVIDVQNKSVKVNGTDIAFTGAFPEFARGSGRINFSHTMTSATFNYLAYYYKRFV